MNIYEVIVITTFVIVTIIMICQYIDTNVPKVSDVLQLKNVLPYYEVRAYRDGKRLKTIELVEYINSPVKAHEIKGGILYIEIY